MTDTVTGQVSNFKVGDMVRDYAGNYSRVEKVEACDDTHDDIFTDGGEGFYTSDEVTLSPENGEPTLFAQEPDDNLADWEKELLGWNDEQDKADADAKYRDDLVRESYLGVNNLFSQLLLAAIVAKANFETTEYEVFTGLATKLDAVASLIEAAHADLNLRDDKALRGPYAEFVQLFAETKDPIYAVMGLTLVKE